MLRITISAITVIILGFSYSQEDYDTVKELEIQTVYVSKIF